MSMEPYEGSLSSLADTPFGYTLSMIGGKWRLVIMYWLVECETMRFNELKRKIGRITDKTLSRQLKDLGFRISIDDFGSGNNGETSLLDYHVDFVKIDMEIVRDIDVAKDHQDIARNLIVYAHDRGIRVIAEGVETEAELRALRELGADYVQGYLTGRPAPEPRDVDDEVKRLIRSLNDAR